MKEMSVIYHLPILQMGKAYTVAVTKTVMLRL